MNQFNDFNNPQVANLPAYLRQYVVEQHYEHYTPADQAVWRYVMRQNYSYLKNAAYYPYIPGLRAAGLTIEHIPRLEEMNNALGKIGWGAVTVDGFIPPAAFMAFQAYRVLVIAADIRQLEHIQYTPAPDIIHESAGHAPIIADKAYHEYLSYFGSIGAKAMFSSKDFELYEAIRELSILKEMAGTAPEDIAAAERKVEFCQANLGEPSEMALLSRLHWWTVEYGLIGNLQDFKIYGAGLLSSIGESVSCMKPSVKKLWYTIDAVNYPYDITKEQPHLFVTPTFENLINVLEEFAATMAFRKGGMEALHKAIECKNVSTAVFSSGLQVTGAFYNAIADGNDEPMYIAAKGGCALSIKDKQIPGFGKDKYNDGFMAPVGKVKGFSKPLEDVSQAELTEAGIKILKNLSLEFENGISVRGKLKGITFNDNKLAILSFNDCVLSLSEDSQLQRFEFSDFDLPVGEKIVSVFSGAADKDAFEEIIPVSATATAHPMYDDRTKVYHQLFAEVRAIRETGEGYGTLVDIWNALLEGHPDDWLCSLEILELLVQQRLLANLQAKMREHLQAKAKEHPELEKLITDGFYLIEHPVTQSA